MISLTTRAAARPLRRLRRHELWLSGWRTAAGLTAITAGAAVIAGALLPWVETFGGLIGIAGIRGGNGRILAAAGAVIAAAGVCHLVRGGPAARWLAGLAGFGALGFSGYLLVQLARSMRVLGGDSMAIARGGPGLWVAAAGSAAAFATLFFPPASQATLRRPDVSRTMLAWAADRQSAGARRGLQIALGAVWLLDAALQYQPYMFSSNFVTSVLGPASMGNPALLAGPATSAARLISHDVVAWNAAFATVQLALAAGLLWRRTARAALAGTVVWALGVWLLAEGAGGVFSGMDGMASPLTGAPGAAVLYALLALVIWPAYRRGVADSATVAGPGGTTDRNAAGQGLAAGSLLGPRWARAAWLVLWGSSAYLILAAWSPGALREQFTSLAAGEPGWLAAMNRATAAALAPHAGLVYVALAAAFALTGAGILLRATTRPALVLAVILALFIWVAGEDFGGILTGQASDPNTGPLLILLAAAFWPRGTTRTGPGPSRPQAGPGTAHAQPRRPQAPR
jgi:hypothetical protein